MNIFVGNLSASVTPDDLRTAFAGYGTVINAIVIKDTTTDRSLGYGHVYLVPEQAAREAIRKLDHVVLRGRPLVVRECMFRAKRDRRAKRVRWNESDRRHQNDRRRNGQGFEHHMVTPAPATSMQQSQRP